ncbi:MAG: GNAT family N-acetyltransferase [Leptolyngbya sp. SIO4C1]|nr:GNAT family N-acetyltransferase [Leptolyngbya sp. SIO4C1]
MTGSGYSLRPATEQDIWAIRWLVLRSLLDPTQLRWQQFWVAETAGRVIACAQLRQFEAAQELGSLVVAPRWRGQGIGRHLTQHLIEQASQPLYLECLGSKLADFYKKLGFTSVELAELPTSIRQKFTRSRQIARLFRLPLYLMQHK